MRFGLKDPRKFWTNETEVMLMTVIMKNVRCISSMQQITDEFIKDECVKSFCTVHGVPEHKFLPHYVTINEFLSRMDTGELEKLRSQMVHTLLYRRKFEDAGLLGKYWMVIFDTTGLFNFEERHCPHRLNKRTENDFAVRTGTEFIENESEYAAKNDCETKAFKRLVQKLKKYYPRLNVCVLADSLYGNKARILLLYQK